MERDRLKLAILGHVLPFYLPNNPKYQNFEKMKKKTGDILLHMYTINKDNMIVLYGF